MAEYKKTVYKDGHEMTVHTPSDYVNARFAEGWSDTRSGKPAEPAPEPAKDDDEDEDGTDTTPVTESATPAKPGPGRLTGKLNRK